MHDVEPSTSLASFDVESELYWLAGLLEGEGSFVKGPPSNPRCPIVQLQMTDKDVIEHAARLFARCTTPWDRRSARPRRRTYTTKIRGVAAVMVMRTLYQVMGSRRQRQIDVALSGPHAPRARAMIGDTTCCVIACDRRVRSRGLCRQHYSSWWKSTRRGRTPRYLPVDNLPTAAALSGPLAVTPPDDDRSIAWLAGLLEGEGTFTNAGGYPRISATMCDRDVLERAAKIIGIPTVSPKEDARSAERGWTPGFQISITGAGAADWMRRLRSSMGQRRTREIDLAIATYHPIRLTDPPPSCVVTACGKPHRSRGLCHKHYMKWDRDRKSGRVPRIEPLR